MHIPVSMLVIQSYLFEWRFLLTETINVMKLSTIDWNPLQNKKYMIYLEKGAIPINNTLATVATHSM